MFSKSTHDVVVAHEYFVYVFIWPHLECLIISKLDICLCFSHSVCSSNVTRSLSKISLVVMHEEIQLNSILDNARHNKCLVFAFVASLLKISSQVGASGVGGCSSSVGGGIAGPFLITSHIVSSIVSI